MLAVFTNVNWISKKKREVFYRTLLRNTFNNFISGTSFHFHTKKFRAKVAADNEFTQSENSSTPSNGGSLISKCP